MKTAAFYCLVLLAIFSMTCSDARNDPFSNEVSATAAASRSNTVVDTATVMFDALAASLLMLRDIYSHALMVTNNANDPDIQVRIVADYSGVGYVSVIDTIPTAIDTLPADSDDRYSVSLATEFKDYYTDNGMLFVEGKVGLYGLWPYGGKTMSCFFVDGTLDFIGDYNFSIKLDGLSVYLRDDGTVYDSLRYSYEKYLVCGPSFRFPRSHGTIRIVSAGETFLWTNGEGIQSYDFNPYAFDREYILDDDFMPPSTREDSLFYGCYTDR